jgi:1,4-dihydroxy-2-naphthoyl-CoA synthase
VAHADFEDIRYFNADTDHHEGLAHGADRFVETDEGREGALAFSEKHKPDSMRFA